MEINDEFVKAMLEFKGRVEARLDDICREIKEMKKERNSHTEQFWRKMDEITATHAEFNKRLLKIETKAGMIGAIFGFITSIITIQLIPNIGAFFLKLIKGNH